MRRHRVLVGVLAAVIALATDHRVSTTIAVAYYIVGCLVFLIWMSRRRLFALSRNDDPPAPDGGP